MIYKILYKKLYKICLLLIFFFLNIYGMFPYSNAVLRNVKLVDSAVSGVQISANSITIPDIISGDIILKNIRFQYGT